MDRGAWWAAVHGAAKSRTRLSDFPFTLLTFIHWRRKWQPTPVFLPGESQGRGSLVGCRLWSHRVGHDWSDLAAAAQTGHCVCDNCSCWPYSKGKGKYQNSEQSLEIESTTSWGLPWKDRNSPWSWFCSAFLLSLSGTGLFRKETFLSSAPPARRKWGILHRC